MTTSYRISGLKFSVMSSEDIERLSVREVTNTSMYRHSIPQDDSLMSLELGTCEPKLRCKTCRNTVMNCVGHYGFIDLGTCFYHPCFLDTVIKTLRCVCFMCSSLLLSPTKSDDDSYRQFVAHSSRSRNRTCPQCHFKQPNYTRSGLYIRCDWTGIEFANDDERKFCEKPFDACVARAILDNIDDATVDKCGINSALTHPRNFVLTKLLVPPPIIRPSVVVQSGSRTRGQEDLTLKLQDILKSVNAMKSAKVRGSDWNKYVDIIQLHLCLYFDKDTRSAQLRSSTKKNCGPRISGNRSLIQRITGKRGRFRGNCMGKRCNYTARSVIVPGPTLDIDEVGVPEEIARRQTFPECVTNYNRDSLQARVNNGPDHCFGAVIVKTGCKNIKLRMCVVPPILSVGDVVHRNLTDGDWIVFNRQPSLHKESMMGHRVVILKGQKAFQLPLPCTTPYNADFDRLCRKQGA